MSAEGNQQLSKALRLSKIAFMASVCVWAGLVGINNVMDYGANFQFVQHVLAMDTTFPGNSLLWRSLRWGPLQHAAYLGSWLEALKKDKNEIFRAASAASKAVDYVLHRAREKPEPETHAERITAETQERRKIQL